MKQLRLIWIGCLVIFLTACSGNEPELQYVERSVEQLYNQALDALNEEEYTRAFQLFEEVDRQHPYSAWATKAQLMSAM